MDFAEKDFPVYAIIRKLQMPDMEGLTACFEKARLGSDDDKCDFATRLHWIASIPYIETLAGGVTPAHRQDTLKSCLKIFEKTGFQGNSAGAVMSARSYVFGLGCAVNQDMARLWLDKAEKLGSPAPLTGFLRAHLPPPPARPKPAKFSPN